MLKLTVFLILVAKISGENCTFSTVLAEVYKHIDSDVKKVSFSDKIQLNQDNFHIFINEQNVPRLCEKSVKISEELSIIQIRNSNLIAIDPGAFDVTPTLTLLKISYNPLTTLKTGVFNVIRTKEIDVSHNSISVIEAGAFENNTFLEVVILSYNAIKQINPNWFRNSNVYMLSMIYNELTEIPAGAFQNMAKNRALKLRLSANMISEIDESAFEGVGNIRNLWINGNKLKNLPGALFENRTVRSIEINTNKLLCFPESLYESELKELEFLDNQHFSCECLQKVKDFVEKGDVNILYPSVICENRTRQVNVVYNFNKTYEIPIL